MSKQETSRKPLIIGIVAAVVILAVLLGVLLTQCTGGETTESTPAQTVGYLGEAEDYDLYWNLDRALYDGKSEAGMSSRKPESDGYFHVRFFIDGKVVELKVADRKTVNAIDVNDLMGLEFDKDGIVVSMISLDDMPLQQIGWKFYVQSIGGNLLKLNSAKNFEGMELLLEMLGDTGIYDMTGIEGEVGKRITPIATDRVIAIANLEGKLTHVYIYERSEYMQTFEAECRHCKQTVTWKEWNKPDKLPTTEGHYQLTGDIQLTKQQSIEEDAKICLDLNGFAVEGGDNSRMYSLHNPGANLALMDTSEEQKGVLRGHSESTTQGGVVWVRYGAFYMYGGTLDASDMTSINNGTAVQVPKETFFYMYGGTIIGGTAKYNYNAETKKYSNGLGGAVAVSGKFVLNDGLITGGKAQSAITAWNKDGTPKTYQRGMGGNIAVASGGVFEMRGGKIQNGVATHSGGNIFLDGTAEMILDGGMITGGTVAGKGRNGGNIFVGSKATLEINGGAINYGTSYNCAGNLYFNGTVTMNGGYIGKGIIRTFGTGAVKASSANSNVFQVGGKMYMYGGIIEGGYNVVDTNATDKIFTTVVLGGMPVIAPDKDSAYEGLVIAAGGSGVKVIVGTLVKGSRIGVNATTGIFTAPTAEANQAAFYSTIDSADILYVDGCIALGRMRCVCGSETHFGACDGTKLLWAPITGSTVPTTTGNYYLDRDVTISAQISVAKDADVKLDLNGKTLTGPKNYRALTTFNEGAKLTVTDTSEGKAGVVKSRGEGTAQGNAVWVRYGSFDLYGGTLDGSGYKLHTSWDTGKDKVFGTKDDANGARDGGTVSMSGGTTFNMYGGTIIGNTAEACVAEKKITQGEGDAAVETVVTKKLASPNGASLSVPNKSVFNFYGGTIRDGVSGNCAGNIYVNNGTMNMYGGTVSGGKAGPVYDEAGEKIVTKGWGGNLDVYGKAVVNLYDGLITGGVAGGNGGNIRVGHANATLNLYGGIVEKGESVTDQGGNMFLSGTVNLNGGLIRDGKAANGGNLGVNSTKDVTLKGVTVTGGVAAGNGGNIRNSTTNKLGRLIIAEGTVISGGVAGKSGGNISVEANNANKNDPVGHLLITGGIIDGGRAGAYDENGILTLKSINGKKKSETTSFKTVKIDGKNVNVEVVVTTTELRTSAVVTQGWGGNINMGANTVLEMSGGEVLGGKAMNGGNIFASGASDLRLAGGRISGGVAGCFDADGKLAKMEYTVITEERLKLAEEYVKPESFDKNEEAKFEARLETQKLAEAYYVAPEAKTVTKQENICAGWGGNLYLYTGSKAAVSGATVSDGMSGGNGGGIYVSGSVFTMSAGTLSGNTSVTDNGGNLWVGGKSELKITGGVLKDGAAYKNGGNLHTNAGVITTLDNVTISGGSVNGKTNNKSANVNLMAGDVTIGNVNIAGYVSIGGDVKLAGKPVIKGGELNLTLNGHKVDVSGLDAGTDKAMVGVSDNTLGIFSGKADLGEENYFFSDHQDKGVVYVDGHLALGLGRSYCLCGHGADYTGAHLPGCDKTLLFWRAWTSAGTLPVDSGNYYLTKDITVSAATVIQDTEDDWELVADRDGTSIVLDLNGHTVQNKEGKNFRLYRTNAADVSLTVTDTAGGGTMKNNAGAYTQGGLIWLSGQNNSLTVISGIFDVSDYNCVHASGGAAVAVEGKGSVFTMYGGTIYAPGAKVGESYGSGLGSAVFVNGTGTMYLKGGHIEGGLNIHRQFSVKSEAADGTVTYNVGGGSGAALNIAGRLEMSGGSIAGGRASYGEAVSMVTKAGKETLSKSGGNGGNIYLSGTMIMTGGTVSGGKAGWWNAETGEMEYYIINSDSSKTTKGWGGNIDVASGGRLEIMGTAAVIEEGKSGGNGGNIRTVNDTVLTMTGGTVANGQSMRDQGGNIFLSGRAAVSGGLIEYGEAVNGGNIAVNSADRVEISGGTVQIGTASGYGGNIRINSNQDNSQVTIGGSAEIKDGSAANGGNIAVNRIAAGKSATLTIEGGTVTGGKATTCGGSVYVGADTLLNLAGGTVTGGTAKNGGNIFVAREQDKSDNTVFYYAAMNMTGGTVTEGDATLDTTGKMNYGGNIYIDIDTTVTVSGGTISNGQAGGDVEVGKDETSGEPITETRKGWGGNIYVGGSLQLSGDASVSGGMSQNNGGSIHDAGDVSVSGNVSITGGFTRDRGGNIFVSKGKTLTVSGGTTDENDIVTPGTVTISGGQAGGTIDKDGKSQNNKGGGNISTNEAASVSLSDVNIRDPHVDTRVLRMANIEVGKNVALTIGNGTNISGGVGLNNTGVDIRMSGRVVIYGGESCANNLYLNGQYITLGEMAEGSNIRIDQEGRFSNDTVEAYRSYFAGSNANHGVELIDNKLWLGHYDCLCAGAGQDNEGKYGVCVGSDGGCTQNGLLWMPWSSESSLPIVSGNWYLTKNVTMTGQSKNTAANQVINIDLNGKTVQNKQNNSAAASNIRLYWIAGSGTHVTLTDGVGTGKMINNSCYDQGGFFWLGSKNTHLTILAGELDGSGYSTRGTNDAGGALIHLASKATLDMYGGTVRAGSGNKGLAVCVNAEDAAFNMHSGFIYGGTATYQAYDNGKTGKDALYGTGGGQGGAVYVDGIMTMTGGTINPGSAVKAEATNTRDKDADGNYITSTGGGQGDSIYVTENGSLTLSGGNIYGGVDVSDAAASVEISGSAVVNRTLLQDNTTAYSLLLGSKELTVNNLTSGASIKITADEGVFTNTGRVADDLDYFSADSADQGVTLYGGVLHLGKYACICGSTSTNDDDHKHYMDDEARIGCSGTKVAWTPWTSTTSLPTTTGHFYLTGNVAAATQTSLAENADVVLDLNGYKVTPAQENGVDKNIRMISLHNSGAKLTLTDTYTVPATTDSAYDASRTGGEIVGSTKRTNSEGAADQAHVVWLRWAGGWEKGTTFVMLGGKLTGCGTGGTMASNGGVVNVNANGTFYMLGGTVYNGYANNGGNVDIATNARMIMTGGHIYGGTAKNTSMGGAIRTMGDLSILGGEVEGQIAMLNYNGDTASLTLDGTVELDAIHLNKYSDGEATSPAIDKIPIPEITIGGTLTASVTEGETTRTLDPISITTYNGVDHYFATTNVAANAARFCSGYDHNGVYYIEVPGAEADTTVGKLYLGKYNCLCGGNGNTDTANGGTCVGEAEGCDGELHVWKATAALPKTTGYWYLTRDLTLTTNGPTVETEENIALDLNGYSITMQMTATCGGRLYSTNGSGTNRISFLFTNSYRGTDTTRTGKIIYNDAFKDSERGQGGDQGRFVWFTGSDKHLKVYNVDFDVQNAKVRNNAKQNGFLFLAQSDVENKRASMELYNVTVTGGNANGSVTWIGKNTDVLLHNTSITGHTGSADCGGVYLSNAGSKLTLSGSSYVADNRLSDGTTASNIRLVAGAEILLAKGYTGHVDAETEAVLHTTGITAVLGENNAPVSVIANADGSALTYGVKDLFVSDDMVLGFADGSLKAYPAGTHIHCVCAGTLGNRANGYVRDIPGTTKNHVCEDIVYTAVSGNVAGGSITKGVNYYLTGDVTVTGSHYQMSGIEVNICLAGHNWFGKGSGRALSLQTGNNHLTVTSCAADMLDANDIPINNRVVASGTNSQGFGVWVRNGQFDLYAGHIDGRDYTGTTGSLINITSYNNISGEMNMYGGSVFGGTTKTTGTNRGGNIAVATATGVLNLYGGKIYNGNANTAGGNLYIENATVNMYGGLITDGMVKGDITSRTGNVAFNGTARLNISGGEITGAMEAVGAGAVITVSGDAKLTTPDDKNAATTDDGFYRLLIAENGTTGMPMLSMVVGELNEGSTIMMTNAKGASTNVNYLGQFATAMGDHTITAEDLAKFNLWWHGGTSAKYKHALHTDTNTLWFEEK